MLLCVNPLPEICHPMSNCAETETGIGPWDTMFPIILLDSAFLLSSVAKKGTQEAPLFPSCESIYPRDPQRRPAGKHPDWGWGEATSSRQLNGFDSID